MSISLHITDHARAVYAGKNLDDYKNIAKTKNGKIEETDKTHHFKFSIDRAQLIAQGFDTPQKIDQKMLDFFSELSRLQHQFVESNGYTKAGTPRIKTSTVDFSNALIAYHDSNFQHKTDLNDLAAGQTRLSNSIGILDTEPHFHIRFDNNDRGRGKDFVNARNAIAELAKKHGLTFHFMEQSQSKENTQNQDKLSRFSWALQKATNYDIRQFVREGDKLTANLDLLYKEAQKSGQLQYYIKTINHLQKRLEEQNLSFEWRGHDIRQTYPLAISQKDLKAIQTLQSGSKEEIEEMLKDRSSKIARAYLESVAGMPNHVVVELAKRGFEFQKVNLSELDLSQAQRPKLKEYFAKNRSTVEAQKELRDERISKESEVENLKTAFAIDLFDTLKTAKNEIELKEYLVKKGWTDIHFKMSQNARIGLKFSYEGAKQTLLFQETELASWKNIRPILEANSKLKTIAEPTSFSARGLIVKKENDFKIEEYANIDIYSADSIVDAELKAKSIEVAKAIKESREELQKATQEVVNQALKERSKTIDTPDDRKAIREYAIKQMSQNANVSIFLTGEGGSGKSHTTREVIKAEEKAGRRVAKLGSTGIAACNIGGQTLHSFFGIGVASNAQELKEFEAKNPKIKNEALGRIKAADTIIIDEISMVHKNQMDLIEQRLREANWQGKLIYVGDFLQIPPVHKGKAHEAKFAFESELWQKSNTETINLFGNMRVKIGDDPQLAAESAKFTEVLNRVRYGDASDEIVDYLYSFKDNKVDESEATHIFATNREVKAHNAMRLESVDGELFVFKNSVQTSTKLTKTEQESLFDEVPIDKEFEAKIGAKVMLLSNDAKADIYNGDRAVVEKIEDGKITVKMERTGKAKVISKKDFEVEFTDKNGTTQKAKINGYPMRLSYAITAHKSQGLSLKNTVAYSKNIFENAQFYVALSRATDPKSLKIIAENKEEIRKAIKAEIKSLSFMHKKIDIKKAEMAQQNLRKHKTKANKSVGIELTSSEERKIGRINDNLSATRRKLAKLAQNTASELGSIVGNLRDAYSSAAEAIHERISRARSAQARQDREHDFVAEISQSVEVAREATKAGSDRIDGAERNISDGNEKTRVSGGADRRKNETADAVQRRAKKELDDVVLREIQKQNQREKTR